MKSLFLHLSPYVESICEALGSHIDKVTRKMMKKQGVPRKSLTDAPKAKVYKNLGWAPPKGKRTLKMEFDEGYEFAAEKASDRGLELLRDISKEYEERYSLQVCR